MVCRLCGANPLSEPMMAYCLLDLNPNTNISIQENALEKEFSKLAAILSRFQCVNDDGTYTHFYRFIFI